MIDQNSFLVRKATLLDLDILFNIVNQAYYIEKNHATLSFKNCNRYLNLNEVQSDLSQGTYLCCMDTDFQVIGVIYYRINHQTAFLGPLAVFPDYQRQGVGTLLLKDVQQRCCQQGCTYLELYVVNIRTDLFAYYEDKGFHLISNSLRASDIGLSSHQLTKDISVFTFQKQI